MSFATEVKELRKRCLLSQEDFAKEIGVSFSTVNRWETGKTLPNYKALKSINEFCKRQKIDSDFSSVVDEKEDENQ